MWNKGGGKCSKQNTILQLLALREVQVRVVTPGLRASSTRFMKGCINGMRTWGMDCLIREYANSISCSLQKTTTVFMKDKLLRSENALPVQ